MSRVFFTACAALSVGLFGSLVSSNADAKGLPSFSSIAEQHVPDMLHPRDAPQSIAETERLAGVTVQRQSFGNGHASLIVSGVEGRCVTIGAPPSGLPPSGAAQAAVRVSTGAIPLRTEQLLTDEKGQTQLVLVDAWIDVTTSAVREAVTTRVPLASLAKGPAGYVVYGFREGGQLQVVLPAPERLTYVDAKGSVGVTTCGHVRLAIDPTARAGEMVLAAGHVQLPSAHRAAPVVLDMHEVQPQQMAAAMAKPVLPLQLRGFQVGVSMSRSSRDREPLLSVTVGLAEEPEGLLPNPNGDGFQGPMPVQPEFGLD